MSFQSLLQDEVRVYARAPECETWTQVAGTGVVRCRITALSASGARRESRLAEPDVTHVCRMVARDALEAGQRLKRVTDGQEFVVRNVRTHARPRPGQTILGVAEVARAIA